MNMAGERRADAKGLDTVESSGASTGKAYQKTMGRLTGDRTGRGNTSSRARFHTFSRRLLSARARGISKVKIKIKCDAAAKTIMADVNKA